MSLSRTTVVLIISLLVAMSAGAETVTWTADHPGSGLLSVDLGATFVNVTDVSIRADGYGGGQHGWCEMMEEPWGYDFWLEFTVDFSLDGAAYGSFGAPLQVPYDATLPITLVAGQPDWGFLEDGRAELSIGWHHDFHFDMIHCLPVGYESLTIDQLVLTVTCESVVPTESLSFGSVKALYR